MRFTTFLFALLAACLPAIASSRTIDFSDLRRVVSLSDPQISPDGTRIVFLRSRADFDKDKRLTQLMLLSVRTHQERALTYERTGISSPRWSPDGTRIAFLSGAKHDENSEPQDQIYVLRMDGG